MSNENDVEAFFERSRLTLDLAGLSDEQRREGSVFLGGSAAEYVKIGDRFEHDQIGWVVFGWGDPKAADVFSALLEHKDPPSYEIFPFVSATVVGHDIWSLTLQNKDFDPKKAYASDERYVLIPFDEKQAAKAISQNLAGGLYPRPEMLGKVGNRYVLFEMGTSLDD